MVVRYAGWKGNRDVLLREGRENWPEGVDVAAKAAFKRWYQLSGDKTLRKRRQLGKRIRPIFIPKGQKISSPPPPPPSKQALPPPQLTARDSPSPPGPYSPSQNPPEAAIGALTWDQEPPLRDQITEISIPGEPDYRHLLGRIEHLKNNAKVKIQLPGSDFHTIIDCNSLRAIFKYRLEER